MAIDALIRLGLYDEVNGFAFYRRNTGTGSFSPVNNNADPTEDDITF
jgi:hypothetical protein